MSEKFYYARSYLVRSLAISLAVFGAALYVVFSNLSLASWVVGLFLIIIALYGYKTTKFALELMLRRPVIEVSAEGIFDRRAIGNLPLAWLAIETIILIKRTKGIAIVTNDTKRRTGTETMFSRVSNLLRNKLGRGGAAFVLTPAISLEVDHEQLVQTLKTHAANGNVIFKEHPERNNLH